MKHKFEDGAAAGRVDNSPAGRTYCAECAVEKTDDNADGECLGAEMEQVSFHQAVYDDPEMTAELKLYWLKVCADQYLTELDEHARAVAVLRGGMEVIGRLCAEGQHDLIAPACGVALRATVLKRGPERK